MNRSTVPFRPRVGCSLLCCLVLATVGCGDKSAEVSQGDRVNKDGAADVEEPVGDGTERKIQQPPTASNTNSLLDEDRDPIAKLDVPELPNRLFIEYQTIKDEYDDGKPKRQRRIKFYSDGSQVNDGEYIEWYGNGQKWKQGAYVDGREKGEWTFWHDNGEIAKQPNYVDGQLDGSWTIKRPDGTPIEKRSYQAGKRHGEFVTYDETGKQQVAVKAFENGVPNGVWKTWYPNGQIKEQGEFLNGLIHGTKQQWYENGELTIQEEYRGGRLHGEQKRWDESGKLILTRQYKEGQLSP